jgi:hypothetical protein
LVNGLAWNPDGRLAFAVGQVADLAPPDVQKDFPGPGIYLLDPQSGKVETLVQSPRGVTDAWPQWTADGKTLLYARALPGQNNGLIAEVRARRSGDGMEWVLVEGLPVPEPVAAPSFAQRILAFLTK